MIMKLTPEQVKHLVKAKDRFVKDIDKLSNDLSNTVAQATTKFVQDRMVARGEYQDGVFEVVEAHGQDPAKVQRFDVDVNRGTLSIVVVEEAKQ